ncbi:MAG: hypothetical protein H6713_15695 [Myxococcales bacterium]|nr:hypothetical protein [Myxococcales bacterium]MCB9751418.1 hypothetical protein [Myxococcales bacterium]
MRLTSRSRTNHPRASLYVAALAAVVAASGCSDFYVPPPDSCTPADEKEFVYEVMDQVYLWNHTIPDRESLNFAEYEEASDLLQALKYKEYDRWSYIVDKVKSDALFKEGKFVGFGFTHKVDSDGRVRLIFVHENSPAWRAGMRRGDEFTSINNYLIADIEADSMWGDIWGENEPGVEGTFHVRTVEGEEFTTTIQRDWIDIVTVPVAEAIDYAGERVGYLNFSSFVGYAEDELDAAWDMFNDEGITSLVVDLRYNGGGSVSIARHLIDLLVGAHTEGDGLAYWVEYNDDLSDENDYRNLHNPSRSIDLDHITFITTGRSLSASELVINSVRAHIPTYIVGGTTGGKPVGSKRYEFCDKILWPITFRIRNADGVSDYFDGIAPDCAASDDLDRQLGDADEEMLAVALAAPRVGCIDPAEDPEPGTGDPTPDVGVDPLSRILGGAR